MKKDTYIIIKDNADLQYHLSEVRHWLGLIDEELPVIPVESIEYLRDSFDVDEFDQQCLRRELILDFHNE